MAKRSSTKTKQELMAPVDEMPAHLKDRTTVRGSEDVGADDLVIPRLEICQALSPAGKKRDPSYIEGLEEGQMYNNITREIYGTEVIICPVLFRKEYLLWRDRKEDIGGFHGAFNSEQEALAAKKELERPEKVDVVPTHQHFCLLISNNGKTITEIVISMARSKMKVSRAWNSLIRINGGDRFSRMYRIKTVDDSNNAGDQYLNFAIENFGYTQLKIFEAAEELYNSIQEGSRTVDYTYDEPGEEEEDDEM